MSMTSRGPGALIGRALVACGLLAAGTSHAIGTTASTAKLKTSQASPQVGQAVTFTVTVTPASGSGATPTGTILFKDGTVAVPTSPACTGTITAGVATCTFSFSTLGAHNFKSNYGGDATYAVTADNVAETVVIATSALTLTPSANPSPAASAVTLTATVTGATPTGTVQFTDTTAAGTANLGSAIPILGGQAHTSITPAAAGGHLYGAAYSGDTNNTGSSGQASVNIAPRTTVTAVSASASSATPTASLAFTATVTGTGLTGGVNFRDGTTLLNTTPVALSGGKAVLNKALPAVGLHTVVASYGGDASNAPSTSTTVEVQVSPGGTTPPPAAALQWNYEYDAQGNLTKITDANAAVTQQAYDSLSRNTRITQPVPAAGRTAPVIGLQYDGQDQLTQVTDPNNHVTTYGVTGLGDVSPQTSPDTGVTTNTYYDNGLLSTSRDARGKLTKYTYDELDRLKTVAYDAGTGITLTYDEGTNGKGHLTTATDEAGTTKFTYDGFGRLLTQTQTTGPAATAKVFTLATTYGASGPAAGKPVTVTYPSGAVVLYAYDGAGRVNGISVKGADGVTSPVLTGLAYTALNQPRGWFSAV